MPKTGFVTSSADLWIVIGMAVGIGIVLLIDVASGVDIRQHFRPPRQWLHWPR